MGGVLSIGGDDVRRSMIAIIAYARIYLCEGPKDPRVSAGGVCQKYEFILDEVTSLIIMREVSFYFI